jgi:hypothetical protein
MMHSVGALDSVPRAAGWGGVDDRSRLAMSEADAPKEVVVT